MAAPPRLPVPARDSPTCRTRTLRRPLPRHARRSWPDAPPRSPAATAPVGWKIGFNTPPSSSTSGCSEAVVGYLVDDRGRGRTAPPWRVAGWTAPAVEVEVADPGGRRRRGGRARSGARAGRPGPPLRRHRADPGRQHLPTRRGLRRGGPRRRPLGHGGHRDRGRCQVVAEGRPRRGPRRDGGLRPGVPRPSTAPRSSPATGSSPARWWPRCRSRPETRSTSRFGPLGQLVGRASTTDAAPACARDSDAVRPGQHNARAARGACAPWRPRSSRPTTSKNRTGNESSSAARDGAPGDAPALLVEDARGRPARPAPRRRPARPRAGSATRCGRRRQGGEHRQDERGRGHRHHGVEPAHGRDRGPGRGRPPRAPRGAPPPGASPASSRPPGKLTSPLCVRSREERRVRITRASPSSSNSAARTPALT